MQLIDQPIHLAQLKKMAASTFGNLVKAVVDVKNGVMVVDAELHADQEAFLLAKGSKQADLWGINIYPDKQGEEMMEFDSMINLRPSQGNRSRHIEDSEMREKIKKIVQTLVK